MRLQKVLGAFHLLKQDFKDVIILCHLYVTGDVLEYSVTLAYMVYSFYREKKKVSWAQSQVVVQLYSCTPRYCLKSLGSLKKKKLPKESGKTSAYQIRPVLCQWNNQHWLCDTITSRFKFESSEKQHTRNVIIA